MEQAKELKVEIDELKRMVEDAKEDTKEFVQQQGKVSLTFTPEEERSLGRPGVLFPKLVSKKERPTVNKNLPLIKAEIARYFNSNLSIIENLFEKVLEEQAKNMKPEEHYELVRQDYNPSKPKKRGKRKRSTLMEINEKPSSASANNNNTRSSASSLFNPNFQTQTRPLASGPQTSSGQSMQTSHPFT